MNAIKKIFASALLVSISFGNSVSVVSADLSQIKVPTEIIEITETVGEMYCICPELLQAMVFTESTFNPYAENGSCKGLMQVSEKWHKDRMDRLGVTDIYDPYGNILLGADYLYELITTKEYGESITYTLDVYNGNSKAICNEENGIISGYAKEILDLSALLEEQHGKGWQDGKTDY